MRASEIIRAVLDVIDQAEQDEITTPVNDAECIDADVDVPSFKQILGLITDKQYSTAPNERYADISAVTTNAGGGLTGPKHPADMRSDSVSMYPGKVYGAK
jgi:hypothetical protein